MSKKILLPLLALALVSLACGFSVTLPEIPTPGPLQVETLAIPIPTEQDLRLKLMFGAGDLHLSPGAEGDFLLSGTASYNVPNFKPQITTEGGNIQISHQQYRADGFSNVTGNKNTWDFQLASVPMALEISAGAYKGNAELGGLALSSLTVKDGAADVTIDFSQPNLVEMSLLRYETGASNVRLRGLGNANLSALNFTGGAGNFSLSFDGQLQRDAVITIESGVSNVVLLIPENVPASLTFSGGLTNISVPSNWEKNASRYTQAGSGPGLTIIVQMGAGNLTVTR